MRPRSRAEPSAPVLTAWAAGLALTVTLLVTTVPLVRFVYRAPQLQIVLETTGALVALAVAYLLYGRYRSARRLQDLLLAYGLSVVGVANLVFAAIPAALPAVALGDATPWVPLVVRLFGTGLVLSAVVVGPARTVRRTRQAPGVLVLGSVVVSLVALGLALGRRLPPPVDPALVVDASSPVVAGHPLVLTAQVIGVGAYGCAAVVFARQAGRSGDELLRWVAPACALAAVARVNYVLFPSLYSDYVHTGDVLRLGFHVLLLVGAAREVRSYWEAQALAAVAEDRRRMARDLHDGLTQELTYLFGQSRRLLTHPEDTQTAERIGGAAARAIDEARGAIAALTRRLDEPFAVVLERTVDDLGSRYDVRTVTHLDPAAEVTVEQAEALLRITAEAVRNAARHGSARTVEVRLGARPLALEIRDDGTGFDPAGGGRPGGFGLQSMRERAEGTGGCCTVGSEPGGGTSVRVAWA